MNKEKINPILFGLIAGVITYIILYVDVNYENKKLKMKSFSLEEGKCTCPIFYVTLKVPLIIGAVVWAAISYLENNQGEQIYDEFMNNSSSLFDQDIFSDMPNF
tara:strand:- start:908 stop:1219 length:312 start_codon:yes stop_codon:yes gene_type:complete